MKVVIQVKLAPTEEQASALGRTLELCNTIATDIAAVAQQRRVFKHWDLRAITYGLAKASGLSAQPAQLTIKKVVDAYTTRRANARNGNYGPVGSKRRTRIENNPVIFRPDAAQPFDDRCLSWNHQDHTVSIWSVTGRLKAVRFTDTPARLAFLQAHRKGQTDLIRRGGQFYLIATCVTAEPVPAEPDGYLGVDLGVVTIAATATVDAAGQSPRPGRDWSGIALTTRREKNARLRTKLQKKNTKPAKRLLRKRSRKEARFATDINHQISKTIVAEAQRTGRGIAVENLTGIRARVRHRKPQRATMHSWAFTQLRQFLTYKAARAGVTLTQVDPRHTSQMCHSCGHINKKNRPDQATFHCVSCGLSLNADTNAAINIATRGARWWAAANQPNAA